MNGLGFRQANSWLHTWSGLLLGWLLFAVFFTGTLSFFRDEISYWMKPELHGSRPDAGTPERVWAAMHTLAPQAANWSIILPDARNATAQVQWYAPGERPTRAGGERRVLDAGTAQPLQARETRGADFLYRFHFELYGMPRIVARWIVGVATMMMLVAIVSGVITHKKIFTDFFTLRRRKGQRSWMDAHNALAVLALPFHFMITYSGLLLLMFMLMPWGLETAYDGDRRAFNAERGTHGAVSASAPTTTQAKAPASLTALQPLLAQAQAQWPRGVGRITVSDPGTTHAIIQLQESGGSSLLDRGRSGQMRFDGVTGALLETTTPVMPGAATATYNVFAGLHLLRFADPWLRWLAFIGGVLGSAMVATGLVLWVVKRLPQRRKQGSHLGHRLVESLNVASVAGLSVALGAYFWANRLIPADVLGRSRWEIRSFFVVWALTLVHACLRPHRRAWLEQLALVVVMFAALPLYNWVYPHSHLLATVSAGNWLVAGMDLTLLAYAALAGMGVWYLRRPQVVARAAASRAAATATGRNEVTA